MWTNAYRNREIGRICLQLPSLNFNPYEIFKNETMGSQFSTSQFIKIKAYETKSHVVLSLLQIIIHAYDLFNDQNKYVQTPNFMKEQIAFGRYFPFSILINKFVD